MQCNCKITYVPFPTHEKIIRRINNKVTRRNRIFRSTHRFKEYILCQKRKNTFYESLQCELRIQCSSQYGAQCQVSQRTIINNQHTYKYEVYSYQCRKTTHKRQKYRDYVMYGILWSGDWWNVHFIRVQNFFLSFGA